MSSNQPTTIEHPQLAILAQDQPDVYQLLLSAWTTDRQSLGAETFDAMVKRVRSLLWQAKANPHSGTILSQAQQIFLDQFVEYVPDVNNAMVEALNDEMGKAKARSFIDAVYIIDQACRLEITHGTLFDADPAAAAVLDQPWVLETMNPSRASVAYHDAIAAKQTILVPADRELVRLLAGRYHHCDYCKSIRISTDGVPFVSRELEAELNNYPGGNLSDGQKAALNYAEVHMQEPTRIDTGLRQRLEESFSHDQILQLTLEVSCWNYQKLLVALSIAQPANPDFLTLVTLDEHGVIHHGELLDY